MANELLHSDSETGSELYTILFKPSGVAPQWSTAGTPAFEARAAANWANYVIEEVTDTGGTYLYSFTLPPIGGNMVAGWYWVYVIKKAGGTAAIGDMAESGGIRCRYFGYWDGSTFRYHASDAVQLAGDSLANMMASLVSLIWANASRTLSSDAYAALVALVWVYASRTLTQTAAQVASALSGSNLTIHRGDQFQATLTGVANLTGRQFLWLTIKGAPESEGDAAAKLQVTEAGGLVVLNGGEYATGSHASLVVDANAGTVAITIEAAATSMLAPNSKLYYDLQVIDASGKPKTCTAANVAVTADVTRAIAIPS